MNRLGYPWLLRGVIACLALSIAVCTARCSSGGADGFPEPEEALSCSAGLVACDAKCIDPRVDVAHCGASGSCSGSSAGASCSRDNACVSGVCTPINTCGSPRVKCDGMCIDPQTDVNHCGASADCTGANAGVHCQPLTGRCASMLPALCQSGQCSSSCSGGSKSFGLTSRVESFTLPSCVTEILVRAWGAQGGTALEGSTGGLGARLEGRLCVTPGTTLSIVVGEQPPTAHTSGGGGGSFVAVGTTPLFVAGGGGGGYFNWNPGGGGALTLATMGSGKGGQAYHDGGGGGGFTIDGLGTAGSGGMSFQNGAFGGKEYPLGDPSVARGGFGGGGGASLSGSFNGGGGGGFDGGDCGNGSASTGGASFITPDAVTTQFSGNIRSGHGAVEISW